jgi:hypothetical protein
MPSSSEIKEQVAWETERRTRLAVPAFAGGVLYLLSGIITQSTLNGAPTVGLIQGLASTAGLGSPGENCPSGASPGQLCSPRTAEVKFISHHAGPLIAGSVLAALAIAVLTLVLLLLIHATRFRRPETWGPARMLVLAGGIGLAVISVAHQIVAAIETHKFATGTDLSNHAVENALTKGAANLVVDYLSLVAGLSLAVAMIVTMINAMRVGLVTRWMGVVGIISGILIFLPIGGATLEVVPSFWIVAMGILYIGKWPNGQPPAWESGEARPWPSRAQMREQAGGGKPALATGAGDVTPAAQPKAVSGGRSSRKRTRGPRS